MLYLKELRFGNIGCFVGEQRVNFDALGNLIQVDGLYKQTGGSSGAAKSTMFHALDYLFGINTIPNSALQSRRTTEPMWVEADFLYDGLPLTISRSKKLKIDLNGEITTGSSKISEEKLDEIIAIPRHLFKAMLHKEQGKRGFFLNFSPKETNDFLTDCLGLGHFKKPLSSIDAKLLEVNKKIETMSVSVESLHSGWKASKTALEGLGASPIKEVDQDTILQLKAKSDGSNEELKKVQATKQSALAAFEQTRPILTAITTPFDRTLRLKHEKAFEEANSQISQALLAQKDRRSAAQNEIWSMSNKRSELKQKAESGADAKKKAVHCAGEIKKIRDQLCPRCEQPWATEAAKKDEEKLLKQINDLRQLVADGDRAAVQMEEVNKQLEYASSNLPSETPEGYEKLLAAVRAFKEAIEIEKSKENIHNSEQERESRAKQNAYAIEYKALQEKHDALMEKARGQASVDRSVLEAAVGRMRAYEEARVRHERSAETLQTQEKEYREKWTALSQELAGIKIYAQSLEELKKCVKSYLSCCFDEALETIAENATRLVRCVPNMANATLQLSGVWETKEGKIKEEVTAVINLEGDENIDLRTLCGGERSAIDLAVDLSVIELIESKANKGINVFVLDEPFTGLDTVCIEMALEVLKNSNTNKKLIIVDHNPEVKQMVESSLLVVRDGLTSTVIQS
jgi:DNA repair exonuclease SbcCD ATPase subunit